MRRQSVFLCAFLSVMLLGWLVPTTHAAEPWCSRQPAVASGRHADMPCCPKPAQTPAPMDPQCALRCVQLHTAMGIVPSMPVSVSASTMHTLVPLFARASTEHVTPSHLHLATHAPPLRRYALFCTFRC